MTKRLHILIFFIVLIIQPCMTNQLYGQDIDPIVQKVKETSLYSANLDWIKINEEFKRLTKDKNTSEELKEGLQYLLNSLGDKHGHIRYAADNKMFIYYNGPIEKDTRKSSFVNSVINDASSSFSYAVLDNKVGYLKIVGIGPGDVKAQADDIRSGLVELKKKGCNKWIVDLRYNGGGNMEPMIAGLAPLIGEGVIGGAINADDEITRTYKLKDGQFFHAGRLVCEMSNLPIIDPTEKVAVLLSRYTISSGELVAVTFKGRANTKFIGEATAGYTTGNGYDQLTEDLMLAISQDVYMDRNKKKYEVNVDVDELSEFQHNLDRKNDKQIEKAMRWLN